MWAPKREGIFRQPQELSNNLGLAIEVCLQKQFSVPKLDLEEAAKCVHVAVRMSGHPDGRGIVIGTSDFR